MFVWVEVGSETLRSSSQVERQRVRNSHVDPEEGMEGLVSCVVQELQTIDSEPPLYLMLGKRGAPMPINFQG